MLFQCLLHSEVCLHPVKHCLSRFALHGCKRGVLWGKNVSYGARVHVPAQRQGCRLLLCQLIGNSQPACVHCSLQRKGILTVSPEGVPCPGGLPPVAHFFRQSSGRIKLSQEIKRPCPLGFFLCNVCFLAFI